MLERPLLLRHSLVGPLDKYFCRIATKHDFLHCVHVRAVARSCCFYADVDNLIRTSYPLLKTHAPASALKYMSDGVLSCFGTQEGDPSKGMAGSAADPVALLRIYIKRGRLEDAASLALTHLHAWQTQVTFAPHQTT